MALDRRSAKWWLPLLFYWSLSLPAQADTLSVASLSSFSAPVSLQRYLRAWEDPNGQTTPAGTRAHYQEFTSLAQFHPLHPTAVYWLQMPIRVTNNTDSNLTLTFSNLTWVECWIYQGDSLVTHRRTGAFRPKHDLSPGDGRFYCQLPLPEPAVYTLLLRVHHTKHYTPVFDFALQEKFTFRENRAFQRSMDAWMQGAVFIFFCYTLLSWLVSRFRPYSWLLVFIGGIGLYGISTGGYWIDWVYPEAPATGWLFNSHFLHLGLLGMYALIIDFWQLKSFNPRLYKLGLWLIGLLVVFSTGGFCIDYFLGNYYLTTKLNLWSFFLPTGYILSVVVACRKRLKGGQRFLYYGIICFLVASAVITLNVVILQEASLKTTPFITNGTILLIFIIFATGLKEQLRHYEIEKNLALHRLNQLQQEQNILLEEKVRERTLALQASNEDLSNQKALLAKRNARIETLINELSHRVKNNLQLLYSLLNLQLPLVQDERSTNILRSNIARIKAMMLVNAKLHYAEEDTVIMLHEFINEITLHLQQVYDHKKQVQMDIRVQEGLVLPAKQTLSVGLIFSELLTNSYKYAFPDLEHPRIWIEAQEDQQQLFFRYADNGIGMPVKPADKGHTMGLSLVKDLVRQTNGTLTITHQPSLQYEFHIPVHQNA